MRDGWARRQGFLHFCRVYVWIPKEMIKREYHTSGRNGIWEIYTVYCVKFDDGYPELYRRLVCKPLCEEGHVELLR